MEPERPPAYAVRCHRCGVGALQPTWFRRRWGLRGRHPLGPTCDAARTRRNGLALAGAVVAGLVVGSAAEVLIGPSWAARLAIAVSTFYLVLVVQTVVHEAGHALTGRLLGFWVHRVVIGEGRPLLERRWGDTVVEVREIPLGGATWALPRSARRYRLRQWVVVAAGLGATAAVGLTALRWQAHAQPGTRTVAGLLSAELVLTSFVLVVINLVPRRTRSVDGEVVSDGWQLVTLPFLGRDQVAEAVADHDRLAVLAHAGRGDVDEALQGVAALAAVGDEAAEPLRLAVLETAQRWDEVVALVERRLADGPWHPQEEAWLCNDLAWALLMVGDADRLGDADRCSARAMALRGWSPGVLGTRGAVLVARGRPEEGLALLEASQAGGPAPAGRALNGCWMAMAEVGRGEIDAGRRHLAEARRTDPDCPLLARAAAAVEDAALDQARVRALGEAPSG